MHWGSQAFLNTIDRSSAKQVYRGVQSPLSRSIPCAMATYQCHSKYSNEFLECWQFTRSSTDSNRDPVAESCVRMLTYHERKQWDTLSRTVIHACNQWSRDVYSLEPSTLKNVAAEYEHEFRSCGVVATFGKLRSVDSPSSSGDRMARLRWYHPIPENWQYFATSKLLNFGMAN